MATFSCDDGSGATKIEAESARAAAQEYVDGGDWSTEDGTTWVTVYVQEVDAEGEEVGERESHTITVDPEEPECAEGQEHDWRSPHAVVGGIAENPGVWGHGGGVVITEVCRHCGQTRVTDTWAQNSATGEQGLHSVRYEDEAISEGAREYYAARGTEAADELDEDEVRAGDESWIEDEGALAVSAYRERLSARRSEMEAA